MSLNPTSISSTLLILAGFAAAFLAALWISLIIWTYRDIRSRSRDPFIHILAILVPIILFIPGILIYLLLRPSTTIEQKYQESLEEESLLHSIEDKTACPNCSRVVSDDWLICPDCHGELKKRCAACNNLLELTWDICPFCAQSTMGDIKKDD